MTARILAADDNQANLDLMSTVLSVWGYDVTTACDGVEALEKLDVSLPDLVLLDIEMPGVDGCEVCRHIKDHSAMRHIPVILVSGRADIADCAWKAGADGFLSKPYSLDELHRQVDSLLEPCAGLAVAIVGNLMPSRGSAATASLPA
jgi:CheY-like chemotaxis protein